MDEISILKDLVKFNTIKDKDNVEILNYIEATLQSMGFTTWHHSNKLVMMSGLVFISQVSLPSFNLFTLKDIEILSNIAHKYFG